MLNLTTKFVYNNKVKDFRGDHIEAQEVNIHLLSKMIYEEDQRVEEAIVKTKGQVVMKNHVLFLTFNETMEDVGKVHNMIKIKDQEATIIRQGSITMRQPLEKGAVTEGTYRSPYGRMVTTTKMNDLTFSWHPETQIGDIYIAYDLTMQGQRVGLCQLTYHLTGGLS